MWPRFTTSVTHGLALDPTNQQLAAVGPGAGAIFDAETGVRIVSFEGPLGHAYDVDFAPDGQSVAVCFHGGHVRRYDASSGSILTIYRGHGGVPRGVRKVKFSPRGDRLATVAEDATLRIWDVESGAQLALFTARADVNSVSWIPGTDQVVFATDVGINIVDVAARKGRARDTSAIAEAFAFGELIYTAWGDSIRVLDRNLDTVCELGQRDVSRIRVQGEMLFAASWRGDDRGVHAWHIPSRTRYTFTERSEIAYQPEVWALALDASNSVLYAGVTPKSGVTSGVIRWSSRAIA